MRRKDREITDSKKIESIVKASYAVRLGFIDEGEVYIVPLNFGYSNRNGQYVFYFHSAKEGRKIDLMRTNPKVGFELDTGYKLSSSDIACECTSSYQSVIGTGTVSIIEERKEKEFALNRVMHHSTGKEDWTFNEKMFHSVCVFKLEVEKLSCKEHE